MSHSFFIQPTAYRSLQHFSQLFFPNWNWTHLLSLAEWEQSENIWLSSPSLLRWENILNHFPQNLYQTIWRREKFYHFDKQAFWISKLKNYFLQEIKTEPEMVSADSEEWTKGSFERNYWVMWLHVLFMYWQLFMKKQSFISVLAAFY